MIPIMIQNGITNFVNMLDNIMIGAVGTAQMTGVGITNQLLFIFNLCIFGAVSGAGIFGAQFFGNGDHEGVRRTYRFKLLFCLFLSAVGIAIFYFGGDTLLEMYMKGEEGVTDMATTLSCAKDYLMIMLIGLVPYAIVQCYASTLREGGYPSLPMYAGVAAVVINLAFNYILIFGKFGAPVMGVKGAAIATVISRFAELLIVVIATHINTKKYSFMRGVYRSLYVPPKLALQLFIKGLPMMLNETVWAAGVAVVNQCYSVYSLDSVAAVNISQTFWNIFAIAYLAVGSAVGVILGQMLGAGDLEGAKRDSYKMITFSFIVAFIMGAVYFLVAEFIPYAYNTEDEIRSLATQLMRITAIAMPLEAITHASYFILRSGGKMLTTFIFDSGFMWCVNVLTAFTVSNFTDVPFITLFALIQGLTLLKAVFGTFLVKRGAWVKNIITNEN